jgi:class 3 adenylate cyclase/tetratricopeptide (TPR) repeat protein
MAMVNLAMVTCPSCGEESSPRFRVCGLCGAQLAENRPPEEIRRIATVVTSDLKGSTALGEKLDPESLREILTRYFDEMRVVFESHGGTIEKIIGDAIVAVFGLPTRRDDDALCAVQAAAETMRVLTVLNDQLEEAWGIRLVTRTGVASGEVIVGELSAGAHVLTGETIRVAGTMEQNAPPLEVLLADSTYQLVVDEVEAEPYGPVFAKGSRQPLTAHRLLTVSSPAAEAATPEGEVEAGAQICGVCGEQNPVEHRFCGTCGTALTGRVKFQESRKTVTIVFADPKPASKDGSSPSPEALRDVMSRYFEGMQRVLDRHGATVEKFIGDAVMAVFGLPVRHEDDALRAVRAAGDMQEALPELNAAFERDWGVSIGNHIGVNTGEVVAGDASLGQRLVSGDTVNVAARLEQAAGPGEVLLGDLTYRLVRGAVQVEPIAPLTLKGKAELVPAYRLTGVRERAEGFERRNDAPMIGREAEMEELRAVIGEAIKVQACRMVTVVGDAGLGKSRLVAEFTAEQADLATIIRGRCLPYGEGITFWPLREAVRDAAGIETNDASDLALRKLDQLVPDAEVAGRLASAIGLSLEPYPVAEVVWGARKFLEGLAGTRPVVMVIDDIQWASPTFLELIGSLIEMVADASVLLLCTSRPNLLEAHPDWATDGTNRRIVLEPLTEADAGRVVQALLGDAGIPENVQARIAQGASGNPLFVEQLLSMLIDEGRLLHGDGRWEVVGDLSQLDVPPTIQALLAARIDLLDSGERAVIEPASVIGQSFARAAVTDLAPEPIQAQIDEPLGALIRKQLIGPSTIAGEEDVTYRFPNILIRDAAYNGLLKRARADFHERFVAWAEELNRRQGRGQEFEEIQGYHLEQAHRYLTELGMLDEHARSVGIRASEKLASAGRRAMARGDMPAAADLLRRAAATREPLDPGRLELLPDLGETLTELGAFDEARRVLVEATDAAAETANELVAARADLVRLYLQLYSGESEGAVDWSSAVVTATERALPLFEASGEEAGQTFAWRMRALMFGAAQRTADAAAAAEQVVERAKRAGNLRAELRAALVYAWALLYGPTPVADASSRLREVADQISVDQLGVAKVNLQLAQLTAMAGDFDTARDLYRSSQSKLEELRAGIHALSTSLDAARVELLAGDDAAAERMLRHDFDALTAVGEKYSLSSVAGLLAHAIERQGRVDEADEITRIAEEISAPDDLDAQALWRGARARVLASRGQHAEALALAREAVAMRTQVDTLIDRVDALMDLAEVLRRAGDRPGADAALREALEVASGKGDVVTERRIREQLAQ